MDTLGAKVHGKVGSSSNSKTSSTKKTSRKKKRAPKSQSAGQASGMLPSSGEPTSEGTRSKRSPKESKARSTSDGEPSKAAAVLMNAMHLVDAVLGMACIIYGSIVAPETEAMIVTLSLGSVLVLGSICGSFGYYSSSCNRVGLVGSIALGVVACLAFIGGLVWVLVSWDSFISYFDPDEEKLTDKNLAFTIALAVLAALEGLGVLATSDTRTKLLKQDSGTKSNSVRSISTGSSSSSWNILSWCGLAKKKRTEDFVMFDDNASMESSLLWSREGGQPCSDDYLQFVPEHEQGLSNYTSSVALPLPPEDKTDY